MANGRSRRFAVTVIDSDGEYEHFTRLRLRARSRKGARAQAELLARRWYGENGRRVKGWWYSPKARRSARVGEAVQSAGA